MNLYSDNPAIERHVARLLPISHLLRDSSVQEISINSGGKVYVDRGTGLMQDTGLVVAEPAMRAVMRLLMASAGRYIEPDAPFCNLILTCGARFHGAYPPVSDEAQISIRTHRRILRPLSNFATTEQNERLRDAIRTRRNIVIGGATSSGKTTLANALINEIPKEERLIIIEDAMEIICDPRHVVRRITSSTADLKEHVRQALRARPDRLLIGEVRGAEAWDLIDAWRTGHSGGLSTIHANSASQIVSRLASLAGCSHEFIAEGVQTLVYITRMPDGRRAVTQIEEIE
jgi:Flp pilus assembly CpaF family ATPase